MLLSLSQQTGGGRLTEGESNCRSFDLDSAGSSHVRSFYSIGDLSLDFLPLIRVEKEKKMSVLLPPPKRQKVYHGIPEPENPQISEESAPNVVVQFVDDHDGTPLAPAVNLPANVTKDALEALVNRLRPQASLSV